MPITVKQELCDKCGELISIDSFRFHVKLLHYNEFKNVEEMNQWIENKLPKERA